MGNGLISIIVPVYNTEKYLDQCIQSVLAQTYTNWELLLIDDGSTDSSGAICDKYAAEDKRIRVFHKENGGVSSARNLGLDNAQGEWISFVDADDWIDKQCYQMVLDAHTDDEVDLVTSDINLIYENKASKIRMHQWSDSKEQSFVEYLSKTWLCPGWILVRYHLFKNKEMRFPDQISIFEDFHLFVRLLFFSRKVAHIDRPLYCYRRDNVTSATLITNEYAKLDDFKWVYNDIISFFQNHQGGNKYIPALYSRILYSTQAMVLDVNKHSEFIALLPEKKKFIFLCGRIGVKMKIMMWCLTHHLSFVTYILCRLRKSFNK